VAENPEDAQGPSPEPEKEAPIRDAHRRGDFSSSATAAIELYGPEVLGFLIAILKDEAVGSDVFSQYCEDLWTGLPTFRWECTFRTWAYTLARNAARRHLRSPHLKRNTRLSRDALAEVADKVRTSTISYLRSEVKQGVQRLREALDEEDQALLILRVDRNLPWNDVARIMLDEADHEGGSASAAVIARKAAALRKRFERVKDHLKDLARQQGLLEDG
jgi:RNA polymerase sigma-70 factor (ECF subfamily)